MIHVMANWKIHWAARKKLQPAAGHHRVPLLLFCCPFENNSCTSPPALGGSLSWEASVSPSRSSAVAPSAPRWSATRPPWVQSDAPQQYASCLKLCKGRSEISSFHEPSPNSKWMPWVFVPVYSLKVISDMKSPFPTWEECWTQLASFLARAGRTAWPPQSSCGPWQGTEQYSGLR